MKKTKKFYNETKEIEAIQFVSDENKWYVVELMKGVKFQALFDYNVQGKLTSINIHTEKLDLIIEKTDWLIKEENGDYSSIKNEEFKQTFKKVKNEK